MAISGQQSDDAGRATLEGRCRWCTTTAAGRGNRKFRQHDGERTSGLNESAEAGRRASEAGARRRNGSKPLKWCLAAALGSRDDEGECCEGSSIVHGRVGVAGCGCGGGQSRARGERGAEALLWSEPVEWACCE